MCYFLFENIKRFSLIITCLYCDFYYLSGLNDWTIDAGKTSPKKIILSATTPEILINNCLATCIEVSLLAVGKNFMCVPQPLQSIHYNLLHGFSISKPTNIKFLCFWQRLFWGILPCAELKRLDQFQVSFSMGYNCCDAWWRYIIVLIILNIILKKSAK